MPIKLNGSTSGYAQLQAGATAANNTLTLPDGNATLVDTSSTQTLTNKTLTSPTISGASLSSPTLTGTTTAAAITASGNVTVSGDLIPSSSFLRNRIINGAMQIWQRGTGSTAITSAGVYIADRWLCFASGANGTAVQTSSVPSGQGFQYSLSLGGGVGNTGLQFQQRIESVNCVDLNSTTVIVSFWVFQSSGGNLSTASVSLYRPNSADNYASTTQLGSTYTIPVLTTSVWTKVTCSFATDSSTSNGIVVAIVNGVGFSSAQGFVITGVQLEVGSVATPFERRQYGQELALCQRYYEICGMTPTATGAYVNQTWFKVEKRAGATLTLVGGSLNGGTVAATNALAYGGVPSGVSGFRQNSNSAGASDAVFSASAEL